MTSASATSGAPTAASPTEFTGAAFAVGVATIGPSGAVLDVSYPTVHRVDAEPTVGTELEVSTELAAVLSRVLGHESGTKTYRMSASQLKEANSEANFEPWQQIVSLSSQPALGGDRAIVAGFIGELSDAPVDSVDAYLRLHLLSYRQVRPNELSMDGIFGLLSNVVWTNSGPFEVEGFESARMALRGQGHSVSVLGVDKFPRMLDYVVPSGVRIADSNRVRLGAHLAAGTTVMHEGYCNFNAGTLGVSMVEGRISQGVLVGDGSDVGGGASIQGTLSGGGLETISIGENCLLGANSGLGISLGNDCIIEAGLYLTAGTLVTMPDETVHKARELTGVDGLLFRRNSLTGKVEAVTRQGVKWSGLNAQLHSN